MGGGARDQASIPASRFESVSPQPAVGHERPHRLASLPDERNFGDFFVGVDQYLVVAPLIVQDGFQGTMQVLTTFGSSFMDVRVPDSVVMLGPTERTEPSFSVDNERFAPETISSGQFLRVRFHPSKPGVHRETMEVKVYWSDGTFTKHMVVLEAFARSRVPEPYVDVREELRPRLPSSAQNGGYAFDGQTPPVSITVDEARQRIHVLAANAAISAASIADEQSNGLTTAKDEVAAFIAKAPESPSWLPLAELALELGIGAVAGVLAHMVLEKVGHSVFKATEETMEKFGESRVGEIVADGLEEGFKMAAKKAGGVVIEAARSDDNQHEQQAEAADKLRYEPLLAIADRGSAGNPAYGPSTNGAINFWSGQARGLSQFKSESARSIVVAYGKMLNLAKTQPNEAVRGMTALDSALAEALDRKRAEIAGKQTVASLKEWVTGLSRANAGTIKKHAAGDVEATNMNRALDDQGAEDGYDRAGLLQLQVFATETNGEIRSVTLGAARMKGVSQEAVTRFSNLPIADLRIPLVIYLRLNCQTVMITRDEAGYVEFKGDFDSHVIPAEGEAKDVDRLLLIHKLLGTLGERSIVQWRATLDHNDSTGAGSV